MARKTCDAFLCTAQVPKKYRYCYDCAKSKGLLNDGDNGWIGWCVVILIFLWFGL